MPIIAEPIPEARFASRDEVGLWIAETQEALIRVPVRGLLESGATFLDDEYLGDGETMLRFNQHGFRAFCNRIGFRYDQLAILEAPSLASQVLNDLVRQRAISSRLDNEEFVLDQAHNIIIGMVSSSYVGYGNEHFISDIEHLLDSLPKNDRFQFQDAYGVNTELTIRYTSLTRHGEVKGRGGEGVDVSELGLEFRNSMVGTSSVRFNYFLHRLACANGMMVPAASSTNRINHSGRQDSFFGRLSACFREVHRKLDNIGDMLTTLGNLDFDPGKLAENSSISDRIFEIIPGSKQAICDSLRAYLRYPSECSDAEKRMLRIEHDSKVIESIPNYFGGENSNLVFKSHWRDSATIFDFLNVFTEHAKSCSPALKLEIEEKAGSLAKYISDNSRKFTTGLAQ